MISKIQKLKKNLFRAEEVIRSFESKKVYAAKLYPAGATTNSEFGVTDISKVYGALQVIHEIF